MLTKFRYQIMRTHRHTLSCHPCLVSQALRCQAFTATPITATSAPDWLRMLVPVGLGFPFSFGFGLGEGVADIATPAPEVHF